MVTYKVIRNDPDTTYSTEADGIGIQGLKALSNETRQKIIKILSTRPSYPLEIAKKLSIHEQKVYYHLKPLLDARIVEVVDSKNIRGTVANRYSLSKKCYFTVLKEDWKEERSESRTEAHNSFFSPFVKEGMLDAKIVVGSPDPHGPHKARARDGHYAIELGLFLGGFASLSGQFSVCLDVDVSLDVGQNLILVGGPVTNLLCAEVNKILPKRFSEGKPWGIKGIRHHSDDNIGLIARIPNPRKPSLSILILAGIRYSGTKAAVIGLTKHTRLVLTRFTGQKEFAAIVQGYDLDADGKIDNIEFLE